MSGSILAHIYIFIYINDIHIYRFPCCLSTGPPNGMSWDVQAWIPQRTHGTKVLRTSEMETRPPTFNTCVSSISKGNRKQVFRKLPKCRKVSGIKFDEQSWLLDDAKLLIFCWTIKGTRHHTTVFCTDWCPPRLHITSMKTKNIIYLTCPWLAQ